MFRYNTKLTLLPIWKVIASETLAVTSHLTVLRLLRSENLQTIREYKSLKKPEFSQMQQRNQSHSDLMNKETK